MSIYKPLTTPKFCKNIDQALTESTNACCRWNVIPVSVTSGDNFFEASSQSPWYSTLDDALLQGRTPCTVVEAIDG